MARDDVRRQLRSIEALAAKAGVSVRYESFRLPRGSRDRSGEVARGGLVRLGTKRLILCETTLPVIDKIAVIAEALASIGIDVIDMPPILRARVHGTPVPPLPRPKLVLKGVVKVGRAG